MKTTASAGLLAVALGVSGYSAATQIPGLRNTGAGLVDNDIDLNYAFSAIQGTATGTNGYGVVTTNAEYPISSGWSPNTPESSWLAPSSDQGASYDQSTSVEGIYNWTYRFSLAGFVPSTAVIEGRWASDNVGRIFLNGTQVAGADSPDGHNWGDFVMSNGFVDGENSIRFEVRNVVIRNRNPTGIRVEFSSSSVTAAPECPPGDFNCDGVVDAADYTVWRDTLGQTGAGLAADGDNDQIVDQDDRLVWASNYGATSLSPSQAVPEPISWSALAAGGVCCAMRRRR